MDGLYFIVPTIHTNDYREYNYSVPNELFFNWSMLKFFVNKGKVSQWAENPTYAIVPLIPKRASYAIVYCTNISIA